MIFTVVLLSLRCFSLCAVVPIPGMGTVLLHRELHLIVTMVSGSDRDSKDYLSRRFQLHDGGSMLGVTV